MNYKAYYKAISLREWKFIKEFETLKTAIETLDYLCKTLPNGDKMQFRVIGDFNSHEFLNKKIA